MRRKIDGTQMMTKTKDGKEKPSRQASRGTRSNHSIRAAMGQIDVVKGLHRCGCGHIKFFKKPKGFYCCKCKRKAVNYDT